MLRENDSDKQGLGVVFCKYKVGWGAHEQTRDAAVRICDLIMSVQENCADLKDYK